MKNQTERFIKAQKFYSDLLHKSCGIPQDRLGLENQGKRSDQRDGYIKMLRWAGWIFIAFMILAISISSLAT